MIEVNDNQACQEININIPEIGKTRPYQTTNYIFFVFYFDFLHVMFI